MYMNLQFRRRETVKASETIEMLPWTHISSEEKIVITIFNMYHTII